MQLEKDKGTSDETERQIIEHMPYLSLLLEDVRELNRALREGRSAIIETDNLLTDLPKRWSAEIKTEIQKSLDEYNKKVESQNRNLQKGTPESTKDNALNIIRLEGQKHSRNVKQLVISVLDSKDLLLLTKKSLTGKTFRIDADEADND